MVFKVPHAIQREHGELHSELARACNDHGTVGKAAQRVERLVTPHFAKVQEFVLPAAGALQALSKGDFRAEMRDVLALAERLRMELPDLVAEHRMIDAALEMLVTASREEDKVEFAELAMRVMMHMQMEEEILYPAVMIAGELLKYKLS